MCGICGKVLTDPRGRVERQSIERMCSLLVHRGPDDDGYYVQEGVGLGMRRLEIIDLEGGKQPQDNEDGSLVLVYNGEIYNFPELRKELQSKGHRFKTNSDTEVILHSYEEQQEDCLQSLNGMFAFALYDKAKRRLFLARDRLGIKPLYYLFDGKALYFASEPKAILAIWEGEREIDPNALDLFLSLEYIPSPRTLVKGMRKLPPGYCLSFQDGRIREWQYWKLSPGEMIRDPEEAAEGLRAHLDRSVKRRMISDVPLGAFLSGGIDSASAVASMAAQSNLPVKTFSIGFEESSYNELEYARAVAERFNTEHEERILRYDAVGLMEKLLDHLDDPIGDFSVFPTYLVSKMAREKVTVILSGDGGDELLGGYDTYIAEKFDRIYRKIPSFLRVGLFEALGKRVVPTDKKKGVANLFKRFIEGAALNRDLAHTRWMIFLHPEAKRALYQDTFFSQVSQEAMEDELLRYFQDSPYPKDAVESQLFVDLKLYLPEDILTKVDRMSMATSLEARVPFLDHELVEYAARISGNLKIRGLTRKYILKKAMSGILPANILKKKKEGFSIPLKNWLRKELKPLLRDTLSHARLSRDGFFNPHFVESLVKEHLDGIQNHSHLLWALMVFTLWSDRHFKR